MRFSTSSGARFQCMYCTMMLASLLPHDRNDGHCLDMAAIAGCGDAGHLTTDGRVQQPSSSESTFLYFPQIPTWKQR